MNDDSGVDDDMKQLLWEYDQRWANTRNAGYRYPCIDAFESVTGDILDYENWRYRTQILLCALECQIRLNQEEPAPPDYQSLSEEQYREWLARQPKPVRKARIDRAVELYADRMLAARFNMSFQGDSVH